MTPIQLSLIRATWSKVQPIQAAAADLFYRRLFELDPKIKPMFTHGLVQQGEKLMATLDAVVNNADKLDTTLPAARALAIRHIGYGVRPEHYDTVGAALPWTLAQGLGDAFTVDARAAWSDLYTIVADAMKGAAYPPYDAA